eukprot:gene18005-23643_t
MALKQRAELIETVSFSPSEILLSGLNKDEFEKKLMTLFKSYDIDKNGYLDEYEFIACIESLELNLTRSEIMVLMASIDSSGNGMLNFKEFIGFFINNLIHLEKEKHLKILQNQIHGSKVSSINELQSPLVNTANV